jgi:hypothetical protein
MGVAEKDFLEKKLHSAGGLLSQMCMENNITIPKDPR